jgi:phosphoglycolate phosphatase
MNYRLLIFDWDGTLADSAGPIVAAMQGAIAALNLPPREDEAIRELIGLGLTDALARLYPELDTPELLRLLAQYRHRVPAALAHEAPLFPGVRQTLEILHAQGYLLAVATGKSRRGMERSLRAHPYLQNLLVGSRCADETASKPDPAMLHELLEQTAVTASQALMIGDTEYDMAMAAAIGMPALGVACGVHAPLRLRAAGARAVIEDIRSLPVWLAAQGSG